MGMVHPYFGGERWSGGVLRQCGLSARSESSESVRPMICIAEQCYSTIGRWMAVFSVIYLSSALALYRLGRGDTSLVYANIISLAARIIYCWFFANSYFRSRGASRLLVWKHAVPGQAVLTVSILSRSVLWYAKRKLSIPENVGDYRGRQANVVTYSLLGVFLALACVGTWWISSGRFIYYRMYGRSR
jgi:oligosaccharide translocation protein RFT1